MKYFFVSQTMCLFICLFSCRTPDPETYLISKGFEGRINIIFSQSNGAPPLKIDGRRIYKVQPDGILLTQFEAEFGITNHEYYYFDSSGKKTSLPIFRYDYNKDGTVHWLIADSNMIGIFNDATVGVYGTPNINFQEFLVSSYKKRHSFYSDSAKKLFYDKVKFALKKDL